MRIELFLLVSLLVPLSASLARAQPASAGPNSGATAPRVALGVDLVEEGPCVGVAAARAAIARELERPVIPPNDPSVGTTRETLTLALDASGHTVARYRDAAGHELIRVLNLPRDPAAA